MENLNVSPAQMYADANGFYEIYTVARQVVSYFQDEMGNVGDFWGDDSFGENFLETWSPGVDGLTGTVDQIGEGMQKVEGNIKNSADLYTASDEVNSDLAGG